MKTYILRMLVCAVMIICASATSFGDTKEVMERFRKNHPDARFLGPRFDGFDVTDVPGRSTSVYGAILAQGATQFESAWRHVDELHPALGNNIGELVPKVQASGKVLLDVMYDRDKDTYKFSTFRFDQYYGGLPVFRSGVGFLVRNEPSYPLVMSTFSVCDLEGFNVGAVTADDRQVTHAMTSNLEELFDEHLLESVLEENHLEIETSDSRVVIFAGTEYADAEPVVALEFVAKRGSVQTIPDYQKYRIVASMATGEVLLTEDLISHVDVVGNVAGRATNGIRAAECDPESIVGLPYAQSQILGGSSVFADVDGNFTIPHNGTAPVTVRSRLRGQRFEVFDQSAGGSIPQIDQVVTPAGPANFVHSPGTNVNQTSNVNCYLSANVCRDFLLFYVPSFPVISTQSFFDINTNINSNCNAVYDGASISFFTPGGGCFNTGFSDVVYHEYGHHMVQVTGNGQGQIGEGFGDSIGVLIQDEPLLGHGFEGNCNAGLRSANVQRNFPCNGDIHDCGQLISGCVWDLRNELIVTEPAMYQDIGAELFFNMMVVRGQSFPGNTLISPNITMIYLELDDDDGDLSTGTPHCEEIQAAFGMHNMEIAGQDCPDVPPPPTENLLWDQQPVPDPDTAAIHQEFPGDSDASVYVANDVTFTTNVTIDTITVYYTDQQNGVWPNSISEGVLNIFDFDSGLGDPTLGMVVPVTITDAGSMLHIAAEGLDIDLDAGSYWIGLTPIGAFNDVGQEFHMSTALVDNLSHYRNPGGFFGFPAGTDWGMGDELLPGFFDAAITVQGVERLPDGLLWNQEADPDGSAIVHQEISDAQDFSVYVVNDVTFNSEVEIDSISVFYTDVEGQWSGGVVDAVFNIFLVDGLGDPTQGTIVPVTVTDLGGYLEVKTSGLGLILSAGDYYIGLTPIGDSGLVGQEFHLPAFTQEGLPSMYRNIGGLFDLPSGTDWGEADELQLGYPDASMVIATTSSVPEVEFVPPATFETFRGVALVADIDDLQESDDERARFHPGFTINSSEAPVWLVFEANVGDSSNDFDFQIESQASTPGLTYTFEAWNWNTNSYDVVGTNSESFNSDSVENYSLTPEHFTATGDVRSRVGWRQTGFTIGFPWEPRVDRVGWDPN